MSEEKEILRDKRETGNSASRANMLENARGVQRQ